MESVGKLRVGLLFGGRSGEHEISIRSAHSVAEAIDRDRWDPVLVGIDRAGRWYLHDERSFRALEKDAAGNTENEVLLVSRRDGVGLVRSEQANGNLVRLDVVFPVLHGTFGEDGTIQGMLEMFALPYVGAGVLGSAVGMDKDVQKRLLHEAGLPIVDYEVVRQPDWQKAREEVRGRMARLGFPVFVKPANLGSSVGISKARSSSELDDAIGLALSYDRKALVERGIDAREIECSVLGNDEPSASLPGEIVAGADFYSYAAKYSDESVARLLIPAPLSEALQGSVRSLAVRTFRTLDCAGMARVDFFLDRVDDTLYVNELNTIPGFTSISMYPKLWEASGMPFAKLVGTLLELALERHESRRRLRVDL
ncbi:MAG TPA: D-alanine--D-alanine ligase family protein [Candidatus Binatia bacterium]|nr:D-alanine--D-alanine ligase family protein [Candidatus Binatia bacterium]